MFDDAFSALDMKTDAKLRDALKEITRNMAVIIVAQRVSTIKDADQIVVLDNGKMVGKGKHLELISSCKVYREIVKSQLSEKEFRTELKRAEDVNGYKTKDHKKVPDLGDKEQRHSGASKNDSDATFRSNSLPEEAEYA